MFQDHPTLTATDSPLEPDRLERLNRVYGYAMALADSAGCDSLVDKLVQLHDHKGTLIAFWHDAPSADEMAFLARAWASRIGAGNANVEHEF